MKSGKSEEVHVPRDAAQEMIFSSLQTGLRFVTRIAWKQGPGEHSICNYEKQKKEMNLY
jgi:hypothetical protein